MQPQAGAGVGEGGAESRRDTKETPWSNTPRSMSGYSTRSCRKTAGGGHACTSTSRSGAEIFNLVSLDGLFEQPVDLSHLESLDVSENSLEDNLDCIAKYSASVLSLKVLKARKNGIRDVGILRVLPNLQDLDLGHNQLERLPAVSGLPRLEVLILSGNRISEVR
ncbi:unnamed protein product [Prorocentrum cordatum]|uniref:Leucine-rich repeat-containing protein 51 n=1 Tax=Prorocentrum cordatum TaxID=2364126 RepID=A0ABN9VGB3_9DINO|nr:unnamed protein product [Polarella glacialis]